VDFPRGRGSKAYWADGAWEMVDVEEKRAGDFDGDGGIVFLVTLRWQGIDIVVRKKGFELVARGSERA